MDNLEELTNEEMKNIEGGEAITLSGIMAILAIAIIVVVCYRFFMSPNGSVELPGGFEFEWGHKSK